MRLFRRVAAERFDPALQRQQLVDGLQEILATKIGWMFVAENWRPGRKVRIVHQVITSGALPDWLRYMSDFFVNHAPDADPYADHSMRSDETVQVWRRCRVLPDAAAEARYASCMVFVRQLEAGDAAVGAYRGGDGGDRIVAFGLHRDQHAPLYTERDFALIRLAIETMRDLEEEGQLIFRADAGEPALTPRQQQVLDRLLAGKAPKEIAVELCLSIHTLREHAEQIYKRYGVEDRAELMSKFLRA
jgi:DNA-binding CsgD family transcriptional regulator